MPYKSPLSRRIIIAFVMLTALVSGLFAYGVYYAVESVEKNLTSIELQREFFVVLDDYHHNRTHSLDSGSLFYVGEKDLPPVFRNLDDGWNEVKGGGEMFGAFKYREAGTAFYLIKKQTKLVQHERLIQRIIGTGFLASILAALLLGVITVKNIIAPVRRLTLQVSDLETMPHAAEPLAAEYPKDEVGHLAGAFDRVFIMLSEALQREALFTSNVSHELRTPLMMIKSSCDLLIAKDQLDDYSKDRINVISKATTEIQELVTAFLALARDAPAEGENASLPEVVQSGKAAWEQYAKARGLTFSISTLSQDLAEPNKRYSRALLRAVLNNLVRNAIHHSDDGEVTLILKSSGFVISDTGPGICEADKPLIYKPFYRGETNEKDGLGLGLSLSNRICKHEGWQISLQNNYPTGCCFEVILQ